jgi:hypothetical protein
MCKYTYRLLFVGPAGTGEAVLALTFACISYFYTNPILKEVLGASRVRELFKKQEKAL